MEMDADGTDVKQSQENPAEPSKRNVRKPRKRPGGIKWVRKLGQLLETQNDWDADLPPWAHGVWNIILSMDKLGKPYLKDKARAQREKQKRKARKKAKQQARKAAGKKARDSSELSKSESTSSSSDESSDSSTSNGESHPGKRRFTHKAEAVSSGALEFKIINGKQAGKWVDCGGPPSKLCKRFGQRHGWHERKEFNC